MQTAIRLAPADSTLFIAAANVANAKGDATSGLMAPLVVLRGLLASGDQRCSIGPIAQDAEQPAA